MYKDTKIKQTSEYNRKGLTDLENKLAVTTRERGAGRGNIGMGDYKDGRL